MFRVISGAASVLAAVVFLSIGHASAGEGKTVRIETRAFYGATISLESGVRVFRPLPAPTHMIINPDKTPINLTLKDEKNVYNIERGDAGYIVPGYGGYGGGGGGLPFGRGFHDGKFKGRVGTFSGKRGGLNRGRGGRFHGGGHGGRGGRGGGHGGRGGGGGGR